MAAARKLRRKQISALSGTLNYLIHVCFVRNTLALVSPYPLFFFFFFYSSTLNIHYEQNSYLIVNTGKVKIRHIIKKLTS